MRIWIVSEGEPLPSDGENVRLRRMGLLSSLMSEQSHEVHWFSSAFHHYKKIHRSEKDTEISINENMKIHLIKTQGYKKNVSLSRVTHHRKLAKWMKKNSVNFEKPDIILATLAPLELSSAIVKYANENKIPVVIDIRDLWPEIYFEVVPKWSRKIIEPYVKKNKKKVKEILIESTSIIGVTPKFLQYGLDLAGIEKREYDKVFYTSYKPQYLTNEISHYEKEWEFYNINKQDFIVAFLGNFGKQFEFGPILEAAFLLKDYPRIKFVLCGLGESYEDIQKRTENLKNVILPGWIEKNKIESLMAISSVGLAPYKNSRNFTENTPNKFGEYLSASLPVILGIDGVMADLLKEYNAGLVYKDGKSLADILEKLSEDNLYNELLAKNAKFLYEEKFNANKVYSELSFFLKTIANNQ